ncbi:MAG TPA: hypothetical protein PLJ44_11280 [Victivallales bacterium]|nr:hypothetical protein [Victivallales bacterium]
MKKLSKVGKMLKGTVSKVTLGVKKSGQGKKTSYLLTYKGPGNKTRTLYVSRERIAEVKNMITKYKDAKSAIENIVELNVQLFKMKK